MLIEGIRVTAKQRMYHKNEYIPVEIILPLTTPNIFFTIE